MALLNGSHNGSDSPRSVDLIPNNPAVGASASELVLVTGANGYVGSHVVYQLLDQGYKVRGSVRKPEDPKNGFLKTFHPSAAENLELVPGDLMKEEGWAEAVKGCQIVMHLASPFAIDPNADEASFVEPAVNGTTYVVQAALDDGGVRRLVLTSSIAAVTEGHPHKEYLDGRVFNEEDWTQVDSKTTGPYEKSKALAEMKAWELVKDKPMELVVICPGLIFGPIFDRSQGAQSASSDMMIRFLGRKYPMVPPISMGTVDVRDVASAHIKGMQLSSEDVANQRFLCSVKTCSFQEYCKILAKEYKQYGFRPPTKQIPGMCTTPLSWVMTDLKQPKQANLFHRKSDLSNQKIKDAMGFEFRDLNKTLYEHGLSLIKTGLLPQRSTPQELIDQLEIY